MCYYTLFKMSVKKFDFNMPGWSDSDKRNETQSQGHIKRKEAFVEFKTQIRKWLNDNKIKNENDVILKKILNDGLAVTRVESRKAGTLGSDPIVFSWNNPKSKEYRELLLKWESGIAFIESMKKDDMHKGDFYDYENVANRTWRSLIFPDYSTNFYMDVDPIQLAQFKGGRRKSRKIHKKRYSRRVASRKYRNRK